MLLEIAATNRPAKWGTTTYARRRSFIPLRMLLLIVLGLGLACVGRIAVAANEPPTVDRVEQFIATTLPAYWKVNQLSLSDPIDYGNPIEPEWRWRYEASIVPNEPLYVDRGRYEGVMLLEPSLDPESPQTLYGVAIATFHAGSWSGEARHENRPFDHGGQPASFFLGRTVVVGSPEERELREATWQRELEELEARHNAEIAALKIEHQAALARAKDTHRTALENLKAEHDANREHREAEHQNELARAAAQHAEQVASLEADLKAEAAQRRVEITVSEKLTEIAAEASQRLSALHTAEAQMLAASERVHEARTVALKKLFDMLGVVTGPDDYLALLDTASESQIDWMRLAVLRHGLESADLALSRAAWRHLLQADVGENSDLQNLATDYLANLKDNPDLALPIIKELLQSLTGDPEVLQLIKELLQSLTGNPEVLQLIKDTLPSISQWANEVVNFSSQYQSPDYAAIQVLGEPNSRNCSDAKTAWVPRQENSGNEFVRVRFVNAVLFPKIGVHQTLGAGTVRKIILWDTEGNGTEFNVQDPLRECSGVATFQFDAYTKPVNEITVMLDTSAVSGWNEIDAISLSGKALEVQ